MVGTARRLTGVVLVDARGTDNGEPPQHVARGGAERDHRGTGGRRMAPAFARERPTSSLLKPSMRWCCLATLLEMSSHFAYGFLFTVDALRRAGGRE